MILLGINYTVDIGVQIKKGANILKMWKSGENTNIRFKDPKIQKELF